MKKILALLAVVIIGVGAWWYWTTSQQTTTSTIASSYVASDFRWDIKSSANFTDASPFQNVTLLVGSKTYATGEHEGCKVTDQLSAGQISKVQCWWGGGGEELAVFQENASYILKKRWIQESGGPEVNAEPNGPWEVVSVIQ